jgi:hypothetical protein
MNLPKPFFFDRRIRVWRNGSRHSSRQCLVASELSMFVRVVKTFDLVGLSLGATQLRAKFAEAD